MQFSSYSCTTTIITCHASVKITKALSRTSSRPSKTIKAMSETVTMEDVDEQRRVFNGIAYEYGEFCMRFHPEDLDAADTQWDNLPPAATTQEPPAVWGRA